MDIKALSLEERIGQTLIVGLDVPNGSKMYQTIDTIVLNCCEAAMDRINRKSKIIEII